MGLVVLGLDVEEMFAGGVFEISEVEIVGHAGAKDNAFVEFFFAFFKVGVGVVFGIFFMEGKDLLLDVNVSPIGDDAFLGVELFGVLDSGGEAIHGGVDVFVVHAAFEAFTVGGLGVGVIELHEAIVEALVDEARGDELVHAKDVGNGFTEPGLFDLGEVDFDDFAFHINGNPGDLVEAGDEIFI